VIVAHGSFPDEELFFMILDAVRKLPDLPTGFKALWRNVSGEQNRLLKSYHLDLIVCD
jgi:hypothetical protein